MDLFKQLSEACKHLSIKDQDFACDMLRGFQKYGRFSDRQIPYVHQLIQRATENARPKVPGQSLDLTGINAMFDRAKVQGLKRMKVRFLDEQGNEFAVSPAGATSRNAGMLYVKAGDTYLGKIDREGVFYGASGTEADAAARAQAALIEFNRDPEGKAKLYGKMTSHCCFCGLELNDPRSVMAGYGPICAENYGLPIPSMAEAKAWVAAQGHA